MAALMSVERRSGPSERSEDALRDRVIQERVRGLARQSGVPIERINVVVPGALAADQRIVFYTTEEQ